MLSHAGACARATEHHELPDGITIVGMSDRGFVWLDADLVQLRRQALRRSNCSEIHYGATCYWTYVEFSYKRFGQGMPAEDDVTCNHIE